MTTTKNQPGFIEKLTFFLANVGNIPIMTLISSYLLIFYTDVVGLNAAAVGTLFLITKIVDGVNDPVMGFLIDHMPRTKRGKFKTGLFIGAVICSINFFLLWFGPAIVPVEWKIVVAYITYLLIGITFDIMDISLNSMIPVMTADLDQRNKLSSIKGMGYMLGTVIVSVGAPLIISAYDVQLKGYFVLILIATLSILFLSVIGSIGIKERIGAVSDEKYSIKQMISFLAINPVMITFLSQLLFISGKAVVTASDVYYATYIMGDIKLLSLCSAIMLAGMIPAILLTGSFVKKFSKKSVYATGILIFCTGPLLRLFDTVSTTLMLASYVVIGLGAGMVMVLMYGIQADNIDYVEYSKGIRAEGAVSSLQSFVAKVGGALGAAIPAYILSWTGYVANVQQTQTAISGIVVSALIVPAFFCVASSLLFLFGYKLDGNKLIQVTQALEDMRNMRKEETVNE